MDSKVIVIVITIIPKLYFRVMDMAAKEANIGLEVLRNQGPEIILAYADDIDTLRSSTVRYGSTVVGK